MSVPFASLSIDLDNQWSYMKTHGEDGWQEFPSYLDAVVPRILRFFADHETRVTFFIVGQDAVLERNRAPLKAIVEAGHEIGNHSFSHEPWLHRYAADEAEVEIRSAHEAIENATGVRPTGFRGPGYSLSPEVLRILTDLRYEFDATTLPTFIGPLARAYYLRTSELPQEELEQREALFGRFSEGFRLLKPYRWQLDGASLMEIPVTTMPILRIPIHFSYLLYLAGISGGLSRLYFGTALRLCRWRGVEPSLLFHPLDFLDNQDVPQLSFFPGMNVAHSEKLRMLSTYVTMMQQRFGLLPMGQHARELAARPLRSRPTD